MWEVDLAGCPGGGRKQSLEMVANELREVMPKVSGGSRDFRKPTSIGFLCRSLLLGRRLSDEISLHACLGVLHI